jgi:hypothetical protein
VSGYVGAGTYRARNNIPAHPGGLFSQTRVLVRNPYSLLKA